MNQPPEKDALYYLDKNGLMVFTEKYHLQRGYCCKCGCRHCPYGFKKEGKAADDNADESILPGQEK
ncbi:MAG: DUF5522 domain-containing protein [Bacteroidota bacterium]